MKLNKKKIGIVASVIASVLTVATILGVCLGKKADNNISDNQWTGNNDYVAEGAFIITPENRASAMSLAVSTTSATENNVSSYVIRATTTMYDGDIKWSVGWTGTEVFWNSGEKTKNANECVTLSVIDNRSVLVKCLKPFGQPIAVTAALASYPSISDSCVCNYEERVSVTSMRIGFNSFLADGSLGYALIDGANGIMPASVNPDGTGSLPYSCAVYEYSYTQKAADRYSDFYFSLTPNMEVFAQYGLDMFSYKAYYGTFEFSLTGSIENFFDKSWCQYAVENTDYSISEFICALVSARNNLGFAIDSSPAYTLTIYGLPGGDFSYDYGLDLYTAINFLNASMSIQLNNSTILFKG